MCGIAGFIGKGSEDTLRDMVACIRHRGPDYQGHFFSEGVGLGHARLSIIDLSPEAHQPFFNNDKSVAIVFNGEIYNYLDLKKELEKDEVVSYRTTSDTEVVLYLYEKYGEKFLNKLNGMFAIAIYDFRKKQLLLAKDRMGKKPMYYSVCGDTIVFGSELKVLMKHPLVRTELNYDALNQFLTFEYVPTPSCIIKNVNKLEPASFLIWKDGRIVEQQKYWNVNFNKIDVSEEEAKQRIGELLDDSTKIRMMSDVPLGVFLSGGLDSTTVAYYAAKNSEKKIKTFSIGFEDRSYDESDYAKQAADFIGTDHHLQILTPKHALDLIPNILNNIDEPFADPSLIPFYFLSKYTREHVTVALGGDGSDEMLAGYPTFISHRFIQPMRMMPGKDLLLQMIGMLNPSDKNISTDFKIKQFLRGFSNGKNNIHTLWLGAFLPKEKEKLFTPDILKEIHGNGLDLVNKYSQEMANKSFFDKVTYVYYNTYLLDDILVKVDRASMLNSLECRSPFLDHRLVEYISSIPRNLKIKGLNTKYILKELMRNKIPENIISRPKKGFGIPVSSWLRNELKELCCDLLSEEFIKKQGLFNYNYIEKIKAEHFSKKKNHRKLLWTLMMFQYWNKIYIS